MRFCLLRLSLAAACALALVTPRQAPAAAKTLADNDPDHDEAAEFTDDTISPTWRNVVDNGKGRLPGVQYCSGGHTNALVPLWVRGSGAKRFAALVKGIDAKAAQFWAEFGGTNRWNGAYVDNTDVFKVIDSELPR